MRVGKGLALSSIFSALYFSLFLHILEKYLKNLNNSYNVVFNLLFKFSLLVKHSKTEVFHFFRLHRVFNPSSLNLSTIGSLILHLKETQRYLGFIFDRKLLFHQHIDFYANKAIKCMKILDNSMKDLILHQKCLLYRSCTLLIPLYSFQMQFYTKAPLSYPLKILEKLQRWIVLWITEIFKTASSLSIEAIIGLIPIQLHLQKLSGRSELRVHIFSDSHIL